MLTIKVLAGEALIATVTLLGSANVTGIASEIVLFGGALSMIAWAYTKILRPVSKIVRSTAAAVGHLEELPAWREAVQLHNQATDDRLGQLENSLEAVLRDLDIPRRATTGDAP